MKKRLFATMFSLISILTMALAGGAHYRAK